MSSQPVQKDESNLKHADRKFSFRGFDLNQIITKNTDELQ